MIKGQDIVCISTSDWDRPWGSKQEIMLRLSKYNRVLYVEYQASVLHLFLSCARIKKFKKRITRKTENLILFTPYPCLPFGYYFRAINMINQKMLLWSLRKIISKFYLAQPILWIYSPSAVDLIGKMREKFILYHCIADFPSEKGNSLRFKTISAMDEKLVKMADIILTLTAALHKKFLKFNPQTYLFPSAIDENLFSMLSSAMPEPSDISHFKKPLIGLIGYLDGNILDVDLLHYIADTHLEWSFVLIGPRFRHRGKLKGLMKKKNIRFIGEKSHREVPAYIKCLDVCIIPYRVNDFINNVSPLKLYEYLALGKPIVSTNFSNLEDFRGLIRISNTKEDFVRDISASLLENNKELTAERVAFAYKNSWQTRLQMVSELISRKL